jgi:hypothetical protein
MPIVHSSSFPSNFSSVVIRIPCSSHIFGFPFHTFQLASSELLALRLMCLFFLYVHTTKIFHFVSCEQETYFPLPTIHYLCHHKHHGLSSCPLTLTKINISFQSSYRTHLLHSAFQYTRTQQHQLHFLAFFPNAITTRGSQ